VGAGHDLVENEVNGVTFPSGNATALATRMRRFLQEPALVAKWGTASRAKAREWTPEAGAARWMQAFAEVIDR
jgi:glycosyltransferase involved in cell wall biosynthesis